jgi:hypothetical protein
MIKFNLPLFFEGRKIGYGNPNTDEDILQFVFDNDDGPAIFGDKPMALVPVSDSEKLSHWLAIDTSETKVHSIEIPSDYVHVEEDFSNKRIWSINNPEKVRVVHMK